MANGVMTGTGTQANPFLCEDIFDFCNLNSYNGSSVSNLSYVKLVNNLDFNDHSTHKYGLSTLLIDANYLNFDGDNKEIRNIIIKAPLKIISLNSLNNTNFPNFIIAFDNNNSYANYAIVAAQENYCNYGIKIFGSLNTTTLFYDKTMNHCTYNIKGRIKQGFKVSIRAKYNCTHINLNTYTAAGETIDDCIACFIGNNYSRYDRDEFLNSYVTGVHRHLNSDQDRYPAKYFHFVSYDYTLQDFSTENSYFLVEFETLKNSCDFGNTPNIISPSFVDKQKNKITTGSSTNVNFKSLLTSQATSSEYLNSIGFLVTPVAPLGG